ncbi:hypothetical protein J437_LFUL006816 [Ladona fulva]|uniref:Uncharacterized protein n=1 Tax=Ladona fulva TaxID=123851 RepID=A0A8K0NXR9_LADFU|nr:hypothetical protein J437_LFUL006816 [Ladona fulva]
MNMASGSIVFQKSDGYEVFTALTSLVLQHYEVRVLGAFVTRGNTAVLRCQVPSVVREYLTVTSWLQDDSFNIYPSSDGGKRAWLDIEVILEKAYKKRKEVIGVTQE